MDDDDELSALVARGNIYLSSEVCERYFKGIISIALIEREGKILILPLTPESGGGLLLKIRNARGDCVIHAQEFMRDKGFVEEFRERKLSLRWSEQSAALVISDLPKRKFT